MGKPTAIIIPLSDNEKEITDITLKAIKVLEDHNGIKVKDADAAWTVVYKTLEETIKWIVDNRGDSSDMIINYYNLFDIGVTYRESDNSEKDGNLTPYLKLKPDIIERIKNNKSLTLKKDTPEDLLTSVYVAATENTFEIDQINSIVVEVLLENNHIECCQAAVPATITVVFIRELFNWLNKNNVAGDDIAINFCRLIHFGMTYVDDELIPFMSDGQRFKLLVKNDNSTEKDD